MKSWIARNRFLVGAGALFLGVYLAGEISSYLRHGGLDVSARECITRIGGVAENICEGPVNYALCVNENVLEASLPCHVIGTLAPGETVQLAERPPEEEARFIACRDPYRPTRGRRQEKSLRYFYTCGPGESVLRLTE